MTDETSLLNAYNRFPIDIDYGKGVYLFDVMGKKYLDFGCGIAVNNLGHCHPYLSKKLKNQVDRLWHCSNIFTNDEQNRLAGRYVENSFASRVFFCSSGLEAVETAIKLMRKNGHDKKGAACHKIISFKNGFHGRSLACLSVGGNDKAREGFGPMLKSFEQIDIENVPLLEEKLTENVCGVLIEPIQSEGGVRVVDVEFLKKLREITKKRNILLCFDEVQSAFGRMGSLFYYQKLGVEPDLITCAKGIGNGFPLAACLMTEEVASVIKPGQHGSTYGGNPMGMVVGNAVLDILLQDGFFEEINAKSEYFFPKLQELGSKYPEVIQEVRGAGMMFGLELNLENVNAQKFMEIAFDKGLAVTKACGGKVIRILPPLISEKRHLKMAVDLLHQICQELSS